MMSSLMFFSLSYHDELPQQPPHDGWNRLHEKYPVAGLFYPFIHCTYVSVCMYVDIYIYII